MKLTWLVPVVCAGLQAQESSGLTARELFYKDDAAAAKPPVKPRAKAPAQTPAVKDNSVELASNPPATDLVPANAGTTPTGVPVIQAGLHLGVRYNVLKVVDRESNKRESVDSDSSFRAGDCVAIELAPNRNGFLYVFNRGTTGAWQPLLPSPDMPNERNRVFNLKPVTIPTEHCFEFDANAGTERLLVVITEKEEDARRLSDAMRQRSGADPAPPPPARTPAMLAGGRIPHELEMMRAGQMIGRDIKIAKVGVSRQEGEPANAVYAVKTSASVNDRLVIEIALRHE
jgi:Domain of unknown function (DUF4384)